MASVIASPNDTRAYRHVVLDNGLKVLLISDPETDKSAAAMDVAIGLLDDYFVLAKETVDFVIRCATKLTRVIGSVLQ